MNAVSEKPGLRDADALSVAAPTQTRRSLARRVGRPVALIVVVIAAALAANWWFTEATYIVSTDNAYVQGDIAVLGPRIEGDVIGVEVGDNQAVHAGDVLFTLDPADRQAQLESAKGAADEAAAAIVVATRQVDEQRATIAQSDAAIALAQAEVIRATAEASRTSTLVGSGWTSRQANDTAVADRRKADALLASAIAQRETARVTLTVVEAQQVQTKAKLEIAQAQMRVAQTNLNYTVLRAPFDGVIGNRSVRVGQHVMPGQQLIAVAPTGPHLYAVANFKETELTHVRPGQKVVLTADIDTAHPLTGRVDSLAPATGAVFSLLPPENATGNFTKVVQRVPVRISIDHSDHDSWLRAGLSVTTEVDTRGPDSVRHGIIGAAEISFGKIFGMK